MSPSPLVVLVPTCPDCTQEMRLLILIPTLIPTAQTRVYTCDACQTVVTRTARPTKGFFGGPLPLP